MIQLDESRLRFQFGDSWTVLRYDASSSYRSIAVLSGALYEKSETQNHGTRAVDFVAVRQDEIYFIEVKNFEGHERQTRARLEKDLDLEVGLKVRDTLAGLVGAVRRNKDLPEPLLVALGRIASDEQRVNVIAWIERHDPPQTKRWMSIGDALLEDRIKKRLRWLNAKVLVTNSQAPLRDIEVTRLSI